jgi:hypothetical protein
MLLLAGVMLGQALTSAMDHLPPLDDAAMLWVYQWWPWPIVGIVGFAAFVTAIALPWDDQWFRK